MVTHCANPKCLKPLLYLREGRIFVFDMPVKPSSGAASGRGAYHLEHFWLCGDCAQTLQLQQSGANGVRLIPRRIASLPRRAVEVTSVQGQSTALAS